jgi:hypothetical protein
MKIAVAVIAVLALALGTAGTVYGITEAGTAAAQARQIRHDRALLRSMGQRVSSLETQVANLNVPTDPLSAYNYVCNQDMTNQSTGVTQTYWFPCTNQAQTIPQPGN